MSGWKIDVKRCEVPVLFAPDAPALVAYVTLEEGSVLGLSRLEGEPFWLADSLISGNGAPVFVHGEGSRTTGKRTVSDDLAAALDAAAGAL